ncbi:MAG TPA: hypothetical protein PKE12_07430 [Kiritimatiellia bacterium]|nr:hypothetical protein [Kiritimatiellia bacterium]
MKPIIDLSAHPQQCIIIGAPERALAEGIGVDVFLARANNAPPADREDLWAQYFELLDQARPGFLRIGLASTRDGLESMCPWDDAAGRFDPAHRVWAILKRLDDWCVRHDTNWMLDPWWTPASLQVPAPAGVEGWRGAPADPDRYARDFIVPLVRQVRGALGAKRCRWLGLFNEPIWDLLPRNPANFGVRPGDDQVKVLAAVYHAVRAALEGASFKDLQLVGPGHLCAWQFPPAEFLASGVDPSPDLGAWDLHAYFYRPDWFTEPTPDFPATHEFLQYTVRRMSTLARQQGKPFFITELGSFFYGRPFWGERDYETLGSHSAAILDAQFIVRALAEGVDGFCRWAWCVDRTNDGRWSLAEWEGRDAVTPSPNVFPVYSALMNAIRPRAEVCAIRNTHAMGHRPRVHAAAVRNTDGRRAVALVHDMPGRNADIQIEFPADWAGLRLRRTITDEMRKGQEAEPVVVPTTAPHAVELMITPYSVTILDQA